MAIAPQRVGLGLRRHYTTEGVHPYDEVRWERRDARITNYRDGSVAFEQLGVEVPESWSQNATNILAQKYFRGTLGTPEREWSLKQVADRVVDTLTAWGIKDGYFVDDAEAEIFRDELKHLIVHQKAAFNSPVWFNIGVKGVPQQGSACFILSVEDSMDSILNWYTEEGIIFKGGSGAGVNLSKIRSSQELLKGGGTASGPVSFMRGADASAGTIKSGGKCFREGTLVSTPDGLRPIEQLRIGELVLTHQGPRRVADFMPNGHKQCYRVTTREGYEVEVTRGHKFAYWDADEGRFAVKPIEEFVPGDSLYALLEPSEAGAPIALLPPEIADPAHATTTVEMRLPSEVDDRLAYILGLSYGDGELRRDYPYRLRVAFCKDEAGRLSAERFSGYCEEVFGERPLLLSDDKGHQQLGFTRKRLVEFLVVNGIAKGTGHALGFPKMLLQATAEVRAAFVAGVIDAGGTYQQRGGWSVSSIDRPFLVELQRLLLSLGVPSKLKLAREARGTWRNLYRLQIVGHTFVQRLVERIGVHSAKAQVNYRPSPGADKGWGYRPSLYRPMVSRVVTRGGRRLVERTVGQNETSGYRAVATLSAHSDQAVADYAREVTTTVQLTLQSVVPSDVAPTYDIEVEGTHLLSANGIYASNTRRAAKMVILDADHPDIEDFIWCKAIEERKARVLAAAGFDMDLDGSDSYSIQYQNANNSVRVTDEFMEAVIDGRDWELVARTDGSIIRTVPARDLFRQIAHAAWECADPGMQFDTTINRWHTAPNTGRINGSNPCCFVGETQIITDQGLVEIAELRERCEGSLDLPGAVARNPESGDLEHRDIVKAWIAGYTTRLVEVKTHKGGSFRCTPDHRFLTVDHGYVEARLLQRGMELRSVGLPDQVVGVERITLVAEVPVYDMEVAAVHNFAVAVSGTQGVIVSNSEYMHLDNSACNLASLNLMRFLNDDGSFDVDGFKAAVEVVFTGQEIIVGNADYPTEKIAENSRRFRELGLGYANLGALLMANGLPYDSDAGRAWAGAITALLTGHAYATSARTAARMGPFAGYYDNAEPMLNVLRMHQAETAKIDEELVPPELLSAAQASWDEAVELGEQYGVRNSQASVLAPTGCLVGGTLVPTGRGIVRLRSLGDPDGEQWQALDTEVATDEGPRRSAHFYVNGAEPVVTVDTRRGYRIRGTTTHRVKVVDPETGAFEWRRFADLRPGDRVPLALGSLVGEPQVVALPPLADAHWTGEHHARVPRMMTAELAELIGYFMGDGSLHSRGIRLCVTAGDFDVAERLAQLGKECFGLEATQTPKRGYTELRFDSVRLALWWEACGFAKHAPTASHVGKGYVAHVPDAVLHSNDRQVYAAFIRGLFEADGDTTGGYPTLRNTSVQMVRDVQTLLLAMGVPTTFELEERNGSSWGTMPLGRLRVLNLDFNGRWMAEVGFIGGRKSAAISMRPSQQTGRHDRIPVSRALVDRLAPANDDLRHVLLQGLVRGRVSRRLANELYQRTGDAELGHLLSFYYDTVASAELGDDELTYDLSVPDNVTYVANGFISHNTIGLLMDCDTTGVEPDLGLVKTKKLVGGGTMSIVNQTVPRALRQLGYGPEQIEDIVAYIDEHKSIVGAPHFRAEHLPVFACSMGDNTIHYSGHVRMMGAVQPFISGAISKCVTGDTLVSSEEGLVRIGRLYEGEEPDSFRPERMLVSSIDGPQKTDAFYYGGARAVRRVVLRSGHSVTGTPNHRLMVAGDGELTWKSLDEIAAGDEVAIRYGADMWSATPARIAFRPGPRYGGQKAVRVPVEMTDDFAFLLGAYVSEGSTIRSTWSLRITNPVDSVLQRIADAARATFGVEATIRRPAHRCSFVEINSKTVVELFEQLGCGARASAKRIPDVVLRSTKAQVLAFLQGLALDAYATATPMGKWAICLDSPALLDDLQAVLTNLGILHSRIRKFNSVHGKFYDEVYATGPHAQALARLVPFLEPNKAETASRLLARPVGISTADIVPGISGAELHRLLPEDCRARFRYLLDPRTCHVSRWTLERVAALEGVQLPPWLRTVLDDGLHFSPVVGVADAGEREVFDLSVPVTHAFVGNGIVNHNTVNMPEEVTVEDVEQLHIDAWKLGIKAVAIYRDNCKVAQPLSTTKKEGGDVAPPGSEAEAKDREVAERIAELEAALIQERQRRAEPLVVGAVRERLPRKRQSKTFAFRVADCEGYVTVGEYEDGRPGEVFIKVSKQGSTLAGIMDAFSISISLGLQHGVPLATYVRKYTNLKFEPAGITDDPDLRIATSLVDYIFRRLALDYLSYEDRLELGVLSTEERIQPTLPGVEESATPSHGVVDDRVPGERALPPAAAPMASPGSAGGALARAEQRDAPFCYNCGDVMQRAGSCYVCSSCGSTSGCS